MPSFTLRHPGIYVCLALALASSVIAATNLVDLTIYYKWDLPVAFLAFALIFAIRGLNLPRQASAASVTVGMVVSLVLALAGLVIAFTGAVDPSWYTKAAPSLCLLIIGIMLAMQRDADQRRLVVLESIAQAKTTITSLHDAFKRPEHEALLVRIARLLADAEKSHPFFSNIISRQLTEFCGNLQQTASGHYVCDPQEEARLTNDVLHACHSGLHAVSYQDERWWNSENGRAFIMLQRKAAAARGLQIERIFILRTREDYESEEQWREERLSEQDLTYLKELIKTDASIYKATYTIPLKDVPVQYRRDFVIYDGTVLKEAEPIKDRLEKRATFTKNDSRVARAMQDFDTLKSLSTLVAR